MQSVDEILEQSFGCRFFSQLDLASGYWAIPITEADPEENFGSAECPLGYAMPKLPFRDVWSVDNVVAECKKRGATGLDAYVDNVIISTVSFAEHCNTLAILLTVLDDLGMPLRHDKCEFATSSIGFLGFRLDGQTIKSSLKNIDKIKEFPTPTTRKLLQRFLGLAN